MVYLIVVLFLLIISILIGYVFAAKVVYPKRFGFEETYEIEKENGALIEEEYQSWVKEEVILPSQFAYSIYGLYFPMEGSKKVIVFSHGITYTLFGSVKYMKIFRKLDFNIFIYDNRYHGKSGGKNSTFGFYEKYDLKMIVDWIQQKVGLDAVIGTHGESMGAAISIQHAAIDPRIKFIIEDCSFSDLWDQLKYRLKVDFHLPAFPFLHLANIMSKVLTGMDFHKISPKKDVQNIQAPMIFIHGEQDDFIPVSMAYELYDNKVSGPKKIYIPNNAKHATAFRDNQDEYDRVIFEFLNENHIV
ncbi:MAG: alpha/beta hydrolase [Anaerolineaceae bacterium]|nr:alpha/beta hydrolase [Anaerolineaceae bacterium]